jgi:hypothetical protein
MMFVYALEDLKEGAELTTPYTTASTKRSKSLTKKWGFICACRLCELDERLGKAKAEQLQKLETKSDEIRFVCLLFSLLIIP